jgi:4-nitrophenyl phosphatase
MKGLKKYQAIFFDGDGVLWKLKQPLPGVTPIFDLIHEHHLKWALLTNNNTQTIEEYLIKLENFGIPAKEQNVLSSSTAAVDYLLSQFGKGAHLYVVGMKGLFKTLADAGFEITYGEHLPEEKISAVVAGMDPELNYRKVTVAVRLILNGVAFVATNTDGTFPTPDGLYPGTGMVVGALQFASGTTPYVAGKPHPAIFQAALKRLGVRPEDTLMIGDRLETDIKGANEMGIDSAALLTGVTSRKDISQSSIEPDFMFEDLIELHHSLQEVFQK